MEIIKLTANTAKWFRPIITDNYYSQLINKPEVFAVGAVVEGAACGVIICRLNGVFIDIQYIAVSDAYRRQGIATQMLRFICDYAKEGIVPVVCSFSACDKEDPVYLFFASLNNFSTEADAGFISKIPFSQLKDSAVLEKAAHLAQGVPSFFSLPGYVRGHFLNFLLTKKIYYLRDFEERRADFVEPLCLCRVQNGEVSACMFVEKEGAGDLVLSYAYCVPGAEPHLIGMFSKACRMISELEYENGDLNIAAVDETTVKIINKLFPDCAKQDAFFIAAWDMDE